MQRNSLILLIVLFLLPLVGGAGSIQRTMIVDPFDEVEVDTVILPSGKRALQTSGLVQIDQLFGQDPQASTFFYIGNQFDADGVGLAGDTVRVEIVAATAPLNVIYPAVDVTTTVTAGMVVSTNPERALAEQICTDLEADGNFTASNFRCIVMSDFSGVFIHSNFFNEFGARQGCILPLKCFTVNSTGTTVVTEVYSDLVPRGLSTELSRSPNNPRQGVLAISGSISVVSENVSNIIVETLKDSNGVGSDDMAINGGAGIDFVYLADNTNTFNFIIQKVSCSCQGNGIQFGKYCSINNPLTNGVEFTIVSEGTTTVFANIKSTDDYKHIFSLGDPTQFGLDIQSGLDDLMATASFNPAIILTVNSGDKIQATVRDNLSSLQEMRCRVFGFKRRR